MKLERFVGDDNIPLLGDGFAGFGSVSYLGPGLSAE